MVLLVLIELSATNAHSEPAELAYILANYSPSSWMVGMVMICRFRGYGVLTPPKLSFPIDLLRRPYNSVALPCDTVKSLDRDPRHPR